MKIWLLSTDIINDYNSRWIIKSLNQKIRVSQQNPSFIILDGVSVYGYYEKRTKGSWREVNEHSLRAKGISKPVMKTKEKV